MRGLFSLQFGGYSLAAEQGADLTVLASCLLTNLSDALEQALALYIGQLELPILL